MDYSCQQTHRQCISLFQSFERSFKTYHYVSEATLHKNTHFSHFHVNHSVSKLNFSFSTHVLVVELKPKNAAVFLHDASKSCFFFVVQLSEGRCK